MRKLSIFFLVVLMLAACSPLAEQTQSSPAVPTVSATEAPVTEEASWNTYTNPEAGFSIQYPTNWQQLDLPDENAGYMHSIALQGPEGEIELKWGEGFGGACPDGYQQITVAQGTVPACHTQNEDGTELWSLSPAPIGNIGYGGFVRTNDTSAESREVVLQVLSTLSFP